MAPAPVAVFWFVLLAMRVAAPIAVFNLSVSKLSSESQPTAALATPVVRLKRSACPFAVVLSE